MPTYINERAVDIEMQNHMLRVELTTVIRWITIREQRWQNGVKRTRVAAGLESNPLTFFEMRRRVGA